MKAVERVGWVIVAVLVGTVARSLKSPASQALNAHEKDGLILAGRKKLRSLDYGEAARDFTEAILLDDKDALAYRLRGVARECQGDATGAIQDLDHALALNPADACAYNSLGLAHMRCGRHKEAIEAFSRGVGCEGANPILRLNRAQARESLKDWNGVVADYETASVLLRQGAWSAEEIVLLGDWRDPATLQERLRFVRSQVCPETVRYY